MSVVSARGMVDEACVGLELTSADLGMIRASYLFDRPCRWQLRSKELGSGPADKLSKMAKGEGRRGS